MSGAALLATSVALGLFVLAGGAYGVLYGVGRVRSSPALKRASCVCYAAQLLVAIVVCLVSPLAMTWKLFLVGSAVAYGFIPPAAWRFLVILHRPQTR